MEGVCHWEKKNSYEFVVEEHAVTNHTSLVMDFAKTVVSCDTLTEPIVSGGLTLDVEVEKDSQHQMKDVFKTLVSLYIAPSLIFVLSLCRRKILHLLL